MNIRDIARKAGVSSATVSRVINESGYVKEETKRKVLEAIEEADYVPNAIARSLSIRDSSSIGVIVPDIANEFFSGIISGIGERAANNQYNIVLFDTGELLERENINVL
ncbi:LacI family DNA-binding transcriptional regulator [Lacrimispora xylanisolvens]|uniref:LacI family DNA-binding transcriptional regulator n=1 Tax=Lacrimispora xylanisolvens TaxID=384636 RepID=UPI002402BBB9